ncbi:MAG: glycosyltransferase family 39 protein [Ignavibacteria bacterium]|nr:glycosyltransferase family 39 protein [Ignavibacteria bacterium]
MKKTIILLIIISAVTALRIYKIDQKNLWFDEIYSWHISQGNVEKIVAETTGDIHPPFYYIILKYWTEIFSDSVISMRLLSVLLSVLSLYFIYRISLIFLKSDNLAYLVLILYAVSPLNIYYSQEVRMLNLNLFLSLGSVYFFTVLTDSRRKGYSVLFIVFTTLAVYTHYFGLLILFTEMVILILIIINIPEDKSRALKVLTYTIAVNILYLPWYPVFIIQSSKGQPWRQEQNLIKAFGDLRDYFKDMFFSSYYSYESKGIIMFAEFSCAILLILILYILYTIWKSRNKFIQDKLFISLFFFIPLSAAIIITLNQSILLSRYLSTVIPYFFMTVVYILFSKFSKKAATAAYIFILMISITGTYIYSENSFKNNDYRKIISYIENNYREGDRIIAEPHFMGWSINYHISHSNSILTPPEVLGWNLNMQIDSLRIQNKPGSIWFITDYSSLEREKYDSLNLLMNTAGYDNITGKTFYIVPARVRVDYFSKQRINDLTN